MFRKITSIILTLFLIFCSFAFIGCEKEREKTLHFSIGRKNQQGEWEIFRYQVKAFQTGVVVEFDNLAKGMYVSSVLRYDDTGELVLPENAIKKFNDTFVLCINVVGRHLIEEVYPGENTDIKYWFTFVVNEARPMPDIVFNGGSDCIESDGEKFTYRYDGKRHFPSAKISYQGEELLSIFASDMKYYVFDVQIWDGEKFIDKPENSTISAQEVGIYKFHFYVGREQLPDGYEHTFREVGKDLIIEIIE